MVFIGNIIAWPASIVGSAAWLPLVIGYLFGSIPFGLLLTRAAGLGDVRSIGSGNIGATNVLRTGHKGLAAATLLLDALKGTAAVLLARHLWGQGSDIGLAPMLAGAGAFAGHIFPVWLGFKGGKGVATYIGVLFGASWHFGLLFCVVWLIVAYLSRYSSLAALVAAVVTPAMMLLPMTVEFPWGYSSGSVGRPTAIVFALMSVVLFWKHSENIARLKAGTEGKIGAKSKSTEPA